MTLAWGLVKQKAVISIEKKLFVARLNGYYFPSQIYLFIVSTSFSSLVGCLLHLLLFVTLYCDTNQPSL